MFLSLRATGWQDCLFYRKTAPTKPNFASYHTHDSVATPRHTARLVIDCSGFSSGRGSAWLERLVRDQEVGGSNPLAPISLNPFAAAGFWNLLNRPTHNKLVNKTA